MAVYQQLSVVYLPTPTEIKTPELYTMVSFASVMALSALRVQMYAQTTPVAHPLRNVAVVYQDVA